MPGALEYASPWLSGEFPGRRDLLGFTALATDPSVGVPFGGAEPYHPCRHRRPSIRLFFPPRSATSGKRRPKRFGTCRRRIAFKLAGAGCSGRNMDGHEHVIRSGRPKDPATCAPPCPCKGHVHQARMPTRSRPPPSPTDDRRGPTPGPALSERPFGRGLWPPCEPSFTDAGFVWGLLGWIGLPSTNLNTQAREAERPEVGPPGSVRSRFFLYSWPFMTSVFEPDDISVLAVGLGGRLQKKKTPKPAGCRILPLRPTRNSSHHYPGALVRKLGSDSRSGSTSGALMSGPVLPGVNGHYQLE